MKKIISLLLCVLLISLTLVSCGKDELGDIPEHYKQNQTQPDPLETLNFYIITGDDTSEDAKITVPQNINLYLKETYNIELNIVYCLESEYDFIVSAAANAQESDERADIVLINSADLFDHLYENDLLVNLTEFYHSDEYRTIQSVVDSSLIESSIIREESDGKFTNSFYTVPNNHRIGEYQFIVINKNLARDTLNFGESEIKQMTSLETLSALEKAMSNYYEDNASLLSSYETFDEFYSDNVKIINGNYELEQLLEYDIFEYDADQAAGIDRTKPAINYVNISQYPSVSRDIAFSSAFAIIKNVEDTDSLDDTKLSELKKHYDKCMTIIYALNTDTEFKNMLQYGYVGTNYKIIRDDKTNEPTDYIELIKGENVTYDMNNYYTGNPYISYYCNEISWDEIAHSNTKSQNDEAVMASDIKLSYELPGIVYNSQKFADDLNLSRGISFDLPTLTMIKYNDVTVSWTISENDYYTIENGVILGSLPENTSVTIILTLTVSCEGTHEDILFEFVVSNIA